MKVGDISYQIEMKSWRPDRFKQYMALSIDGLLKVSQSTDDMVDVVPGQMSKDLIDALKQVKLDVNQSTVTIDNNLLRDTMTKRWRFDSRVRDEFGSASGIADEVVEIFEENDLLVKQLMIKSNIEPIEVKDISPLMVEQFIQGPLKSVLIKMFVL